MSERKSFTIKGKYHKPRKSNVATKTFPSLNDLLDDCKVGWRVYHAEKQKYMNIAILAMRIELKGWKPKGKVRLHFYFCEPKDGNYRDYDNIASAAHKIIIDAMVKQKVLKDDSPKYVLPSKDYFNYTTGIPYIRVEIEETND